MISITQGMKKFLREERAPLRLSLKTMEILEIEIYRLECIQGEQLLKLRSIEIEARKSITLDLLERINELEKE
tara:strand:+ start:339 stop:557 length:219 start_codon:yes stop_codon:yes gene_type:complete